MSKLFDELKRRNVLRVGAAYLVGGSILIQVGDALFPALNLPDWTTRFVAGLVVLGFPVALIMAWAFEVTPEGVKRDSEVADAVRVSGKRLDIATILGVVLVVAIFGYQQTQHSPSDVTDDAKQQPATESTTPSLAVLAFKNMSPDPENAYFAEGISEEILNVLTKIDGLHVASRTSAFSFANTNTPIPEIASQLKVNHVLEGSVRKQNTRVRITAQLIDAETDKHLWSETYDRELDDIFAVQSEIATAITQALIGALGMQQVIVDAPTDDLVAYELFLSGRKHFYQRSDALYRAIVDLRAAVARDAEFAEAWSFLAAAEYTILGYFDFSDEAVAEHLRLASDAAQKALQLDSDQALALAVQGSIASRTDRLLAMEIGARASRMAPNDAGIMMWAAERLFHLGYVSEALPLFEKAVELDPLSGINNGVLGIAYLAAGQRAEGRQHILRAYDFGWPHTMAMLLQDYLHTGDMENVRELTRIGHVMWQNALPIKDPQAIQSIWDGIIEGDMSATKLARLIEQYDQNPLDFFGEYLAIGDVDAVLDIWSNYNFGQNFNPVRFTFSPSGLALVEHPRFLDIGERFNYTPAWEKRGYPMGCERVSDDLGDHLSCPDWPE